MNESAIVSKSAPRYVLMAQRLVEEIVEGRYPVGGLLPTEAELCMQYGVSRHTVREAIRQIQQLGLVARHQGVGTRIISSAPVRGYTHTLGSIDDLLQFATGTRLVDVVSADVIADNSIAKAGRFSVGQRLVRFDALRIPSEKPDSLPLAWSEIYIIDAYAGVRGDIGVRDGAVGAQIEQKYGVRITEIQQEIKAVKVDADLARRLSVPVTSPALRIERWYCGDDGKVFEYAISVNPESRYTFMMRLTRDAVR